MNNLVCCSRCDGKSHIPIFWYVQDDICLSCSGSGQIQKSLQIITAQDEWYRVEAKKGSNRITVLKYKSKNIESATQRAQELKTKNRHKLKHKEVNWTSWGVL